MQMQHAQVLGCIQIGHGFQHGQDVRQAANHRERVRSLGAGLKGELSQEALAASCQQPLPPVRKLQESEKKHTHIKCTSQ